MTRRPSPLPALLVLLALLFCAPPARAQVNVETLRRDLKDKWYLVAIDTSFAGRLGNVNGIIAGGSVFGALKFGKHLAFTRMAGDFAKFEGTVTVSKAFGHLRYNYQFLPWLAGEAFGQLQQDKFQRLALRMLAGIGPRFSLVRENAFQLHYGTSWMFEYERLTKPLEGALAPFPAQVWRANRWNNYLAGVLPLSATASLASVFYAQPRFDYPKDIRLLSDTLLTVQIVNHLATKLNLVIRYDSLPPSGVQPTDMEFTNSLSLTF